MLDRFTVISHAFQGIARRPCLASRMLRCFRAALPSATILHRHRRRALIFHEPPRVYILAGIISLSGHFDTMLYFSIFTSSPLPSFHQWRLLISMIDSFTSFLIATPLCHFIKYTYDVWEFLLFVDIDGYVPFPAMILIYSVFSW